MISAITFSIGIFIFKKGMIISGFILIHTQNVVVHAGLFSHFRLEADCVVGK